jgi:hypothetical protein
MKIYHTNIFLLLCLVMMLLSTVSIEAQVITVKQDGTGDFSKIQEAIYASDNGDTVLVYAGVYYENVDLTGKGIVLAGTWVLFHEDSLISQTIIDGNQTGSCIRSLSGENWAQIIGLTLQHGKGTNTITIKPQFYGNGGGILIKNSKFKVIKCRISNNFGKDGAGICTTGSSMILSGNTICHNWATRGGGGIRIGSSIVVLDSIDLNNVYLNYGAYGSDIAISYNETPSKIWLDTATVLNPDQYYIGKFSDWAVHIERPPISVLHGKIEQLNADLYVSSDGDDSFSGLSPDDPLKTISFALLKIATDSINLKTVHVANGTYSNTLNGEHTPLQFKNYINLVGQSMENTIIDCEDKYEGARFAFGQDYSYIKNITFQDGNGYPIGLDGGISTGYSKKLVLDSIALINTTGDIYAGVYSDSDDTLIVKNSLFQECRGVYTVSLGVKYYDSPRYNEFTSCRFSGNHSDSSSEKSHISLGFYGSEVDFNWNQANIINCIFNDNIDSLLSSGYGGSAAISTIFGCKVNIINSTFANNLTVNNPGGGAISVWDGSVINFYNCVLFGNYGCQVYLANAYTEDADTVSIHFSLIQNGQEGIKDYGSFNQVIWGDGNLDSNPVFLGTEQFPYAIDAGSPCIDAGTLDLPPGITLPEYDLAGNPRVYGESVDMGAYEYGPWVGVPTEPNSKFQIPNSKSFTVSPNPFSYGTYISYELKDIGRLNISAYSISGMKVKTLVNNTGSVGDKGNFYWDGGDQNGQKLPAGAYILRMTVDDKVVEVVKVVRK